MAHHIRGELQSRLEALRSASSEQTVRLVDEILAEAARRGASDVHFEPTHQALEVRFRLDGVLQTTARLNRELVPNVVARLKVLAELLTYRIDIPQEGRIQSGLAPGGVDMRVSTFPTIHGEKVVVRLFDAGGRVLDLEDLGLSEPLYKNLVALLRQRSGAVFLTGPSGSGKTTTIYACLRHLVSSGNQTQHIVTIEDPVEQVLEGVSQSQARPGTEFDFARGLRSLLRQDPEVIMIGEVRDPQTAAIAVEAALTGHLVFTTLHAGSACGVVGRLLEMGVEPYLLTSGLRAILNQRLVRQLCVACRRKLPAGGWEPAGCDNCAGTGYRGRILLAELLPIDERLRQAILARADTKTIEAAASHAHGLTIRQSAHAAVEQGRTSAEEVMRVLGPSETGGPTG
jgi:type II secretory ATPase GspE/PulE/Tfp pilus assembly ATPase PilB-like protein